jgi:hypothetical protein
MEFTCYTYDKTIWGMKNRWFRIATAISMTRNETSNQKLNWIGNGDTINWNGKFSSLEMRNSYMLFVNVAIENP